MVCDLLASTGRLLTRLRMKLGLGMMGLIGTKGQISFLWLRSGKFGKKGTREFWRVMSGVTIGLKIIGSGS